MTAPRQVLPGTTYLVTRRCSERRFFLRPSQTTNAIFLYVLAVAAKRYGVLIHAACVLSNHYHLIVTDPEARLPAFVQYLDGLVARAVNASLGRWEGFWASGTSYSAVTHGSPGDVIRKTAYVLANPVSAGLVSHGQDWPGIRTAPRELGSAKQSVPRPKIFFREDGELPESAELELTVPPDFASAQEFRDSVAAEVAATEAAIRSEFGRSGRRFLGRARVLAPTPSSRPSSFSPRRNLNPRVAAVDRWRRLEVLARAAEFVRAYRQALSAWREGVRDVMFPAGTYLLRAQHGVECAASG